MGTRYEDQPPEHWAGAESLDPTPVWKQYALVALLLVVGLVVVVIVAVTALAPTFATPPALVAGERLVLAESDVPAVGAPPKLIGIPTVDDPRSFWLTQPVQGQIYAVRRDWSFAPWGACTVGSMGGPASLQRTFVGQCPAGHAPTFNAAGHSFEGGVRDLDRYLVSVTPGRVIVNLSRVIEGAARTTAPVPTGIPQPQATP